MSSPKDKEKEKRKENESPPKMPSIHEMATRYGLSEFEHGIVILLIAHAVAPTVRMLYSGDGGRHGSRPDDLRVRQCLTIFCSSFREQVEMRPAFYKSAKLLQRGVVKVTAASWGSAELGECSVTLDRHTLETALGLRTEMSEVVEGSTVEGEAVLYTVLSRDGRKHQVPRHRLRLRKRHTIAFSCVSNEKRHDAPTTQHFINRIMRYFQGHATAAPAPPAPVPPPPPYKFSRDESFWGLVHHSDNATHFKSNKMMHYWSKVKAEPPLPPSAQADDDPPAAAPQAMLPLATRQQRLYALGGIWVCWPWQGAMGWVGRHAEADGASRHPPQQHPHYLRLHDHTS